MALRYHSPAPLLVTVVVIVALSACGQRGPLILPDDAAEALPSVADQDQASNDEQEETDN
jgi:predicted small lipoprotein YifL